MNIAQLRERIAQTKTKLARAKGGASAMVEQIDQSMTKLREILGCEAGQEKQALQDLRKNVEQGSARVEALLAKAEKATEGGDDED